MSISPLDRLLNQKDRNDKIRVGMSCRRDETSASSIQKGYDLELTADNINNVVCRDGSVPEGDNICANDPNEALECTAYESLYIELFDLEI